MQPKVWATYKNISGTQQDLIQAKIQKLRTHSEEQLPKVQFLLLKAAY